MAPYALVSKQILTDFHHSLFSKILEAPSVGMSPCKGYSRQRSDVTLTKSLMFFFFSIHTK